MQHTAVDRKNYTIDEYLEMELRALEKYEFDNGSLLAMAGAIVPHNVVKSAVLNLFEQHFLAQNLPFWALNSDTKLRIEVLNKFYYPDIMVVAGNPEYYVTPSGKTRRDTIINPTLIVEVLSDETREFDKNGKWDDYLTNPTVQEYLLIEPEQHWVRRILVQDAAKGLWQVQTETDLASSVHLHTIGMDLPLSAIYRRVSMLPAY